MQKPAILARHVRALSFLAGARMLSDVEVLNASAAARRAGYSERMANRIATENLSKPVIADADMAERTASELLVQRKVSEAVQALRGGKRRDGLERMETPMSTLNLDEAAKLLHTTPDTVSECIKSRGLPAARIGRAYVLVEADVIEWLRSQYGNWATSPTERPVAAPRFRTDRQAASALSTALTPRPRKRR